MDTFYTTASLWTRDLDAELNGSVGTRFYQSRDLNDSSTSDKPNYLIGNSVLCYDCHSGNAAGNGPGAILFNPDPQDIAFGGDGSDDDDRDVPESSGGIPGYYELPDGTEPDNTNQAPTLAQVAGTAIPGGHFIKSEMDRNSTDDNYDVNDPDANLLYRISVGDKIPCGLCHDPHAGYNSSGNAGIGEDEVFFRRQMFVGEDQMVERTESEFDELRASALSRNGTGTGRYMCIYCHGTSDWDGSSLPVTGIAPLLTGTGGNKYTVYGIKTMVGSADTTNASRAFPPPLGPTEHTEASAEPCTECHKHNNINAACGGCHEFPPTSGAHNAHANSTGGFPGFICETCHGPGPGTSPWHNQSLSSLYNSNNSVHFNNITMSSDLNTTQRGAENTYYNQTWTRSGSAVAPAVTKGAAYQFVCTNVYCHGMDPVTWTWNMDTAPTGPPSAQIQEYRLCGGCHGATTDIDGDTNPDPDHNGDGVVDVSSFFSRSGTFYEATSTAANYEIPVSGFSRGGHGDTRITTWGGDTAPGMTTPVACNSCHDSSEPHPAVNNANPYRLVASVNNPGGMNSSYISNLCLNCHPADGTEYAFLAYPKHSNDHYRNRDTGVEQGPVVVPSPAAIYSTYDPVNITPAVGLHIDRYVDHWEFWQPTRPATSDGSDAELFLPLGDSMVKDLATDNDYDNNTSTVITCITCHNPHGSDLNVFGQTPGTGGTLTGIPANKMLRLRDQDQELCDACH